MSELIAGGLLVLAAQLFEDMGWSKVAIGSLVVGVLVLFHTLVGHL